MSIPLVQNNEKDSINTSIIAIKRQIERINMLLGLSNSEEIDTSKFATKEELQQAVTDLQPVDTVTSGNMHSVTSNAVAQALSYNSSQEVFIGYYDGEPMYRKCVFIRGSELPAMGNIVALDLPSEYSNRAVVNIRANMVRDNYTWSIPSGKHFYVWLENRTKLYIEQSMTGYQTYYSALVWLDYVYLS